MAQAASGVSINLLIPTLPQGEEAARRQYLKPPPDTLSGKPYTGEKGLLTSHVTKINKEIDRC